MKDVRKGEVAGAEGKKVGRCGYIAIQIDSWINDALVLQEP